MNIHCIRKDNLQQRRQRQELAHHKTWSISMNRDRNKEGSTIRKDIRAIVYQKRQHLYRIKEEG